jgi:hypothetical protein
MFSIAKSLNQCMWIEHRLLLHRRNMTYLLSLWAVNWLQSQALRADHIMILKGWNAINSSVRPMPFTRVNEKHCPLSVLNVS